VDTEQLGIGELADAAGISRRAVRFYVQQGLIPPPVGKGRGAHYEGSHLERLRKVLELQEAGYSLDAIGRLLEGKNVEAPIAPARPAIRASLSAELWTRVKVMEGVEIHFDARKHQPEVEKLLKLREAIRSAFETKGDDDGSDGQAD
jgi:DNA-binding transcriptional MerR regulator